MKIELVREFCGLVTKKDEKSSDADKSNSISIIELINVCKEGLSDGIPLYVDGKRVELENESQVTMIVGRQLNKSLEEGEEPWVEFDNRHVKIYLSAEAYAKSKEGIVRESFPSDVEIER